MATNFGTGGSGALRQDLAFAYRIYRPEHARNEAMVLLHGSGVEVNWAAMAGEDPLEVVVEKAFHGTDLLGPGVPAGAAKGVERGC